MRRVAVLVMALTVLGATGAMAAEKGSSMLSIGLSQGTFNGYAFGLAPGYIGSYDHPELGVSAEYWYMMSEDYALAIQGTFGFASETEKPGAGATGDVKLTSTSFKGRIGGDRVGQIGDRFTWFMGPGIEFWSGKEKLEPPVGSSSESERTTRFGINGRVGGVMKLSESVGIQGQIGNTMAIVSAKAKDDPDNGFFGDPATDGAKVTSWTSSFNASWGVVFSFGGAK